MTSSRTLTAGLVLAVAAVVAVLGGLALGTLVLIPTGQRVEVMRTVGSAVGPSILGLLATLGAAIAAWSARSAHQATQSQGTTLNAQQGTLDTIQRQTNGALTGGILAAVRQGINEVFSANQVQLAPVTDPLATAPASVPADSVPAPLAAPVPVAGPAYPAPPVTAPLAGGSTAAPVYAVPPAQTS